jgi:lipoteichoic acid synthase
MRSKIYYCVSTPCRDRLFRLFLPILTLKLLLFVVLVPLSPVSFLATLGAILIVVAPALVMDQRWKFRYLAVSDGLFSLLYMIHTVYYRYFNDLASCFDLPQAHQLLLVSSGVLTRIGLGAVFFVNIPLIPFFGKGEVTSGTKELSCCGMLVVMLAGLWCSVNPVTYPYLRAFVANGLAEKMISRYEFADCFGIVDYQILDTYHWVVSLLRRPEVTELERSQVVDQLRRRPKERDRLSGQCRGMNLLVIQVESLQNFVIGTRCDGNEVTPNLNRMARNGIYFRNISDQTGDGNSADAEFLSNASLYPARQGAVSFLHPNNTFDSLPKTLRENGYSTAVLHGDSRGFWNYGALADGLGFQCQFFKDCFRINETVGLGLSDHAFFTQSIDKLLALPRPFYAFMITLSSHEPFSDVTPSLESFPVGRLEGTEIGDYFRAVHYADRAIGDLLQEMERKGLLSRTVVSVYGDHRARLEPEDLKLAGVGSGEESRKVPLIIWHHRTPVAVATTGGLVDFTPTVCDLLGVDVTGKLFLGKNLLRMARGFVIFRDGSFISGERSVTAAEACRQLAISDSVIEKNILARIRR